jgi:YHS domain-containing protein
MKLRIAFAVLPLLAATLTPGCTPEAPKKPAPVVVMSGPPADAPKTPRAELANTVDPICEMQLEEQVAFTAVHAGKKYGFCSSYCSKEFEKDTPKYLAVLEKLSKTGTAVK